MVAEESGTPAKAATTRIARVALEQLEFPSKWTGFGALSKQVRAIRRTHPRRGTGQTSPTADCLAGY